MTGIYTGFNTPDLYAWWSLDDATQGIFWKESCRFEVGLAADSHLYVKVFDDSCANPATATTATLVWPPGTGWHHLIVHRHTALGEQRFQLTLDFSSATTEILATAWVPEDPPSEVFFGLGIDGRLDELLAADFAPGPPAFFDFDPAHCADPNATCREDVVIVDHDEPTPGKFDNFTFDIPVRYKVIYDAALCGDGNPPNPGPCKVVFLLSGGGQCGDNYPEFNGMLQILDEGLAIVAVDPICWAWQFEPYPDEITQVLAVKADLAGDPVLDLSGAYYAAGCSHGAQQVLRWAVENDAVPENDQPQRIFVQSTGLGEHDDCVYHTQWCGVKQKLYDEVHFSAQWGDTCHNENFFEHQHIDTCVDSYFEGLSAWLDLLDQSGQTLVQNREIGRSWGVNTGVDPVCNSMTNPTEIACAEEGGLASTDGGRQFRAKWRALEDQYLGGTRKGYFIENAANDCRHCRLEPAHYECVAEYLKTGRPLSSACENLDVDPLEPAEDCSGYPL